MRIKTINIIAAALMSLGAVQFSYAGGEALKEISMLSEQGNQSAALSKVNSYLADNPKDAEALFMKGVILVELGKRDDAIIAFTDLTSKFPNLPEPYNNLAVLYADKGAYDKARRALETAIKTHPSYATAHENLGDIYARLASDAYNKAFKLDSSNARAQNKLSMITDLFGNKATTPTPTVVAANTPKLAPEAKKPMIEKPVMEKPAVEKPMVKAPEVKNPVVAKPEIKAPEVKKPVVEPAEPKTAVNQEAALVTAANAWAKAWSAQNVEQYLASYASDFKASNGMSRKSWEKQRRQRVSAPKSIAVNLSGTKVKMMGADKAQVSFYQSYKANGKKRGTGKTLTMVNENGKWLIQREKIGR